MGVVGRNDSWSYQTAKDKAESTDALPIRSASLPLMHPTLCTRPDVPANSALLEGEIMGDRSGYPGI